MLSRREFLRVTAAGTAALALPHAAFGGRDNATLVRLHPWLSSATFEDGRATAGVKALRSALSMAASASRAAMLAAVSS